MNTATQIQQLHHLYCTLTNMQIRLDIAREHEWYHWLQRGFKPDDLRLLVKHLRTEIREGRRNHGCLKFRNLIAQVDYFEEDLAEARARARAPKSDPARAETLRAAGRDPALQSPSARPAAEVARQITRDPAAAAKALEELRALKNRL
jgi:hypothetical protein